MTFQKSTYAAGGALQTREVWDSVALTYTVFDGAGNQTSQRALTGPEATEIAARAAAVTADTNANTIRSRAATALTTNDTFIAIASPTAAQVAAQAKVLTRECNGLIRLLLNALSDVTDT